MTEDELIASFRPTFTVGQRVRVRLSGECGQPHEPEQQDATGYIDYIITQDELDGDNQKASNTGDIVTLNDISQHAWSVTYDDPKRVPLRIVGVNLGWETEGLFHALELEPLDVFVEDHADPDDLDEHGHFKPGVDASAAFNRAMREANR